MLLALLLATWTDVATAMGRTGTEMPGGVYKVSFPRSDLDVVAGGVHVKPALALGSWAAFMRTKDGAMAMGDLVLTENEVNDVISALQAGGIEQSALHNHLIGESPRVMYLHFDGHGDEVKLAKTLHDALAKTKTPPPSASATAGGTLLPLDDILGAKGKLNGVVTQYTHLSRRVAEIWAVRPVWVIQRATSRLRASSCPTTVSELVMKSWIVLLWSPRIFRVFWVSRSPG